jgi:hypothetical protein
MHPTLKTLRVTVVRIKLPHESQGPRKESIRRIGKMIGSLPMRFVVSHLPPPLEPIHPINCFDFRFPA